MVVMIVHEPQVTVLHICGGSLPMMSVLCMQILDEGSHLRHLHEARDSKEGITDIKYAPSNRLMAAATADTWVDIYK
jgi:hypothetical protein